MSHLPTRDKTCMSWTHANLQTQGYRLNPDDAQALRVGLRFPTALCLALTVMGLAFESALLVALLVPVGAVAGWTSRHPFDYIWNGAVRHFFRAPELPANPPRRRHAFKLATVWLGAIGALFAMGANPAALILGGILVAVCTLVTVTNFCIPSTMLAWFERGVSSGQSRETSNTPELGRQHGSTRQTDRHLVDRHGRTLGDAVRHRAQSSREKMRRGESNGS